MKKLITILVCLTLLLVLVACNNDTGTDTTNGGNEVTTSKVPAETTKQPEDTTTIPDDTTTQPSDTTGEHSHTFSMWTTTTPPSCTAPGMQTRTCSSCGFSEYSPIPAISHTDVIDAAVEATCTATGLTEGKHCGVCNKIITAQTEVPVKPHAYDDKYDAFCNVCGFERDAACAHTNQITIPGKEATCTVTGLTEGKYCLGCGDAIVPQTAIPLKPHTDVIDAAVEATCTKTGLTQGKHCGVCNTVIIAQTVTSVKPHTEVIDKAVEATCTKTGLTQGKHCGVCTTVIIAQTVVPIKPHTEVIDKAVESTCAKTGLTEGKHCGVCNTVIITQTVIPSKPHTEVIDKAVDATCTKTGLTAGKHCGVCNKIIIPQTTIPSGHTYGNNAPAGSVCGSCGAIKYSTGLAYKTNNDGSCYISGIGSCTDTDIFIPNYINGYKVTCIGCFAFVDCNSLKSVIIPNSVTIIDEYAFHTCSSLTSVTIGNSVTIIDRWAFTNCSSLTSIEIPDSVTSIGDIAFTNCSSLTSITVDKNNQYYKSIDGNLYNKNGTKLVQYAIGKTDTSFSIPNGVTSIGSDAFYNCESLTSIEIPNGVTSIGGYAFYGCSSLTSIHYSGTKAQWNAISKGNNWDRNTGNYTVYCVTSYNYTVNGDGTTCTITGAADIGTELIIPAEIDGYKVTSIGDYAFRNCSKLISITIPGSVTSIGKDAFSSCSSLTSVHISDIASWCKINFGLYISNPLYYADELYLNGELVTNLVIPDGVTRISKHAFSRYSGLTSVKISNGVTSIGEQAFYGCINLMSIEISNSVTSIGPNAFHCCFSLTSIAIPNSVTSIGSHAFYECYSLTSVNLGNGVTSIGEQAFSACSSLTSITIPDSVTSIGPYVFWNCDSLTSIAFEDTSTWYIYYPECTPWMVDVTDASANVTYFSTYYNHYWCKE